MPSLIYARADHPAVVEEPTDAPVMSLADAVRAAEPGTTIRLLPGSFTTKIRIRRLRGREDAQIVIQGALRETRIDGLVDPLSTIADRAARWAVRKGAARDLRAVRGRNAPFFQVESSAWIEWRDLWVERCWPTFLHIRSCHHLTVAGCQIVGGKDAIFIADKGRRRPSHHILIERNKWCQDPSGPADPTSDDPTNRRLWQEWTWHQFKKKPRKDPRWEDMRFMNGGFVSGEDMAGTIIVRHNEMRFAFNAIRLAIHEDQSRREPLRAADIGDAPRILLDPNEYKFNYTPPDLTRNTNVEIYGNVFEYIRDNAVEPEYGASNWWVWNNRVANVHKAWSIHNNGGGFWYFFGNVGGSDAVPPAQLNEPEEWRTKNGEVKPIRKLGGGFFKLLFGPPLPSRPCFAIHNSWRPRGAIVNHGEMRHFTHLNNAVEHCVPAVPGTDLCCRSKLFASPLDDTKPFDFGFATRIPPIDAEAENRFDHDVSTGSDFPDLPRTQGQEANGIGATRHVFEVDRRADYVLAEDSEANGAATPVTLRGGIDWPAQEDWTSEAPDAGAVQPDGLFRGPPFAHHQNSLYDEPPRLVALEPAGLGIGLVFSVPLDPPRRLPDPSVAVLELADGTELSASDLTVSGRRLVMKLATTPELSAVIAVRLPNGFTGGYDGLGLPMTAWAAVLPLKIVRTAEM